MLTTRFLSTTEYHRYGDWLKQQDNDTRHLYFGIPMHNDSIDALMEKITADPVNHNFLIAEQNSKIVGTIHMAFNVDEVEFGVIVDSSLRGQGIGNMLMEEAITWVRNRGFVTLYMHCLSWNQPIRHLCTKHGLDVRNFPQDGEAETKTPLPPADFLTLSKEAIIKHKNLYKMMLQAPYTFFDSVYG